MPPILRQLVVSTLLVLAATPWADAQTDPQLIGTWEAVRVLNADGEETEDSNESISMTLTDDGRLFFHLNGMDSTMDVEPIKASYRVEGAALVMVNEDGDEQRLFYRFEGDELVLTPENGPDETAYLRRVETPEDQ